MRRIIRAAGLTSEQQARLERLKAANRQPLPAQAPQSHDDYEAMDARVQPDDEFSAAEMWDEF